MFTWIKKLFNNTDTPATLAGNKSPANNYNQYKAKDTKAASQTSKRGRKKAGVTKTDLNKMTKGQLEAFAQETYGVDIDKRKKKSDLVAEVVKLAK